MQFVFHTTCTDPYAVGEYGDDINEMTASPHNKDLDKGVFIHDVAKEGELSAEIIDSFGYADEAAFIADWGTTCHQSYFQGIDCLYVYNSGIEHIYVDALRVNELCHGEALIARRDIVEALEETLDEYPPWKAAKDVPARVDALKAFVLHHYSEFREHNVLLGSLFAYGHDHGNIVKQVDNMLLLEEPELCFKQTYSIEIGSLPIKAQENAFVEKQYRKTLVERFAENPELDVTVDALVLELGEVSHTLSVSFEGCPSASVERIMADIAPSVSITLVNTEIYTPHVDDEPQAQPEVFEPSRAMQHGKVNGR